MFYVYKEKLTPNYMALMEIDSVNHSNLTNKRVVKSHNVTRPKPELNCELPDQCQC